MTIRHRHLSGQSLKDKVPHSFTYIIALHNKKGFKIRSTKTETRNKFKIINSNVQNSGFEFWLFGIRICLRFRYSNFEIKGLALILAFAFLLIRKAFRG